MNEQRELEPRETTVGDPIIEVENASVEFDMQRGTSKVLNDVTIDIEREEILAVVGESGSGKSMFADALLDATPNPGVLTGEITYHQTPDSSTDVLGLSSEETRRFRWEEVAMVSQAALDSFNPVIKIGKQFEETLEEHDANVDEGMERARQLLSDLYLNPQRIFNSYAHELSGGMKQRAFIALGLVLEPQVLVMDEPTAALDLLMQRSILSLLKEIQEEYSLTVIFITHDLELVADLADRIAVLYAFEFVERGPVEEIIQNAAHPYTRALLKSTPNLHTPFDEMAPIEGTSPDPVDVPSGCSYHPRCPLATDECLNNDPGFFDVDANHEAACFHWEQSADAIPLDWGDSS